MAYETIHKPKFNDLPFRTLLEDWRGARASFQWEQLATVLKGIPGGGFNLSYECVDRHCAEGRGGLPAFTWEGRDGSIKTWTFEAMRSEINKIANVLVQCGARRGDRIFLFLDRVPELYFGLLATLKAGCVAGPLFSAFGPEAVRDRVQDAGAKMIMTSPALVGRVYEVMRELPKLETIIITDRFGSGGHRYLPGEVSLECAVAGASDQFECVRTHQEEFAIMHYTSGTTGKPKGAAHVHMAAFGHYHTARICLELREGARYWCTADPGWVTGTSYGMFGPWTNAAHVFVMEAGFDAERWYAFIEKHKIDIWYTAPTAIRMLMKSGEDLPKRFNFKSVFHAASVGEPLNPEAVVWGKRVLGLVFHDNWWQTETGCIQVANYATQDVKPGSMGRPIPGTEVEVVNPDGEPCAAGVEGDLVVKPGWPSMFRTYWRRHELYKSRFKKGWYYSGDRAKKDADGYIWFIGRDDDVINTAGHLVGPFEVESALIEHPAVAEAGVIGKPDPERMEVVKAFVSLKKGYAPTEDLKRELAEFVKKRLAAHAYPRDIEFIDGLPKTRSGKIMRRLLKAKELGLPLGDTSTLEE
ncbi:MAG: acetate--CoA ligase [Planctomycetes bacterium]|nr:acetate--CoA ligase [Planctomycetota bacterium]